MDSRLKRSRMEPLSPLIRFYIYGIHGFATEIIFTALWETVVAQNPKFPGNTSLWSFLIYGSSSMVVEQLYFLLRGKVPALGRALIYTVWGYSWEFMTGLVLTYFNSCPWDYTLFTYNFYGLITMEYAPAWVVASLIADRILVPYTLQLHWGPEQVPPLKEHAENEQECNGDIKKGK